MRQWILLFFALFWQLSVHAEYDDAHWHKQHVVTLLKAKLETYDTQRGGAVNAPTSRSAAPDKRIPVIIEYRSARPDLALKSLNATRPSVLEGALEMYSTSRIMHTYSELDMVSATVDAQGLDMLAADSSVYSIYEDTLVSLHEQAETRRQPEEGYELAFSSIEANQWYESKFDGQGQTVAVIDSGILASHEMFVGKVVYEACFNLNAHLYSDSRSTCPSYARSAVGPGTSRSRSNHPAAHHGSHVAGIAAGLAPANKPLGVASQASIISINIFTEFIASPYCGGGDCILAYSSDIIAALERVLQLKNTFNISAVNLSLGGGWYDGPCEATPYHSVFTRLVDSNIAIVAAAGNAGYSSAISSPACHPLAIAVGASSEDGARVLSFSNSSLDVDLLAPGENINSAYSVSDSSYSRWGGTSMATPHVAGAITVARQLYPDMDVVELTNRLLAGAKATADARNGISKPFLQVTALAQPLGHESDNGGDAASADGEEEIVVGTDEILFMILPLLYGERD